jgi:hypothetical protein
MMLACHRSPLGGYCRIVVIFVVANACSFVGELPVAAGAVARVAVDADGCPEPSATPAAFVSAACAHTLYDGVKTGTPDTPENPSTPITDNNSTAAGRSPLDPANATSFWPSQDRVAALIKAAALTHGGEDILLRVLNKNSANSLQPLTKLWGATAHQVPKSSDVGASCRVECRTQTRRWISSTAGCGPTQCTTTQADKLRAIFFTTLNQRGVRYVVPFPWLRSPSRNNPVGAVDLLFAIEHEPTLAELLTSTKPRENSPPFNVYSNTGESGSNFAKAAFFQPNLADELLNKRTLYNGSYYGLKVRMDPLACLCDGCFGGVGGGGA